MKRLLLVLGAVVIVASGVAAVSAYEGHLINVTAHVENAMKLSTNMVYYGTIFPQEWSTRDIWVKFSQSFCLTTQTRVGHIDYSIWLGWKPKDSGGYYPWLGDALYIGVDADDAWPTTAPVPGDLYPVGPNRPNTKPGAMWVMDGGTLAKGQIGQNSIDRITIGMDTPVFEGYYNKLTDVPVKPSGLDHPTVIIEKGTDRYYPEEGVTLGVDITFQVTRIY